MIETLAPSQQFKKKQESEPVFFFSPFFSYQNFGEIKQNISKIIRTCTRIFLSPNFFIKILAKFCQENKKILIRTTQHPAHSILFSS
jgi:hypothetical protein